MATCAQRISKTMENAEITREGSDRVTSHLSGDTALDKVASFSLSRGKRLNEISRKAHDVYVWGSVADNDLIRICWQEMQIVHRQLGSGWLSTQHRVQAREFRQIEQWGKGLTDEKYETKKGEYSLKRRLCHAAEAGEKSKLTKGMRHLQTRRLLDSSLRWSELMKAITRLGVPDSDRAITARGRQGNVELSYEGSLKVIEDCRSPGCRHDPQ